MPPGGIRTHDLSRRAAEELRLRPRGHWDRLTSVLHTQNILIMRPIISVPAPYAGGPGFKSEPKYRLSVLRIIPTLSYSDTCRSVNLIGYDHFLSILLFNTIQSQRMVESS